MGKVFLGHKLKLLNVVPMNCANQLLRQEFLGMFFLVFDSSVLQIFPTKKFLPVQDGCHLKQF